MRLGLERADLKKAIANGLVSPGTQSRAPTSLQGFSEAWLTKACRIPLEPAGNSARFDLKAVRTGERLPEGSVVMQWNGKTVAASLRLGPSARLRLAPSRFARRKPAPKFDPKEQDGDTPGSKPSQENTSPAQPSPPARENEAIRLASAG